jgi:uncharacterized membrane protein YhhN
VNGGALAATLVCASAVASLVAAEVKRDRRGRFMWKPLASIAFCLVPILAGALDATGVRHTVAIWILAGLALGAVGDMLLMFESRRAFTGGLFAFLLGHVAYVVAFTQLVPFDHWPEGWVPFVEIAAGAAAVLVLRWLWPRLGSMRLPVIAYVAVISAMAIGGVVLVAHDNALPLTARRLACAGALAFYLSDLAVARDRFVVKDAWNRIIGLPLYYGGQLLIAWSISVR